jgi:ABC-type branched-subunit amino acid transport system substrate-binding protein
MIKKLRPFVLTLFSLLILSGCVTAPNQPVSSGNAETLPSILAQGTLTVEQPGTAYDPYDYYVRSDQDAAVVSTPTSELAAQAPDYRNIRAATAKKDRVKVAILLPLSGEHKKIGQQMLNAAQMALFDVGDQNFELMPKDTQGDAQIAVMAANDAINQGAKLILGPLFSEEVKAVRPYIARSNIQNISFSTDWTAAGQNTYVMGILPFEQISRIVDYAAKNGSKRFGIISTEDAYGKNVTDSFNSAIRSHGGSVTKLLTISPLNNNISPDVREFINFDARKESYASTLAMAEQAVKLNPSDRAARAKLGQLQLVSTSSELPFDTLFAPVGGELGRNIVNLLRFYEVDNHNMTLLGTGVWDDAGLIREPAFNGSLFAAPSPQARFDFEQNYTNVYGERPARIASLAYDGTALAAVLANKGAQEGYNTDQIYTRNNIQNPNGFAGVDGIFRFGRNNLVERGMAVLEINQDNLIVKEPAPITFQR